MKTNLHSLFQTDESAEKDGVWIEWSPAPGKPPIRIKVARAGGANSKYDRVFAAKTKPVRRQLEMGTLGDKEARRLFAETYAEAVVLDWEGVTDEHGAPVPCTREVVVDLLMQLPELYKEIRQQAERVAAFRATLAEADSGN